MNSEGPSSAPSRKTNIGEKKEAKPDLYIIARIISTLKENGNQNRTALATRTGLAYNRLTIYLDWMRERRFLEISDDGLVFLTMEGIKAYDDLVGWILHYVGKLRFPRLD